MTTYAFLARDFTLLCSAMSLSRGLDSSVKQSTLKGHFHLLVQSAAWCSQDFSWCIQGCYLAHNHVAECNHRGLPNRRIAAALFARILGNQGMSQYLKCVQWGVLTYNLFCSQATANALST